MTTEKEYTKPTYLEVSNHFLHDAIDFKIRYRYCIDSNGPLFYEPKSRRTKCFIDLRMGIESALKASVCYYTYNERKGKTLVNWIEKFSHNIEKMVRKIDGKIPSEVLEPFKTNLLILDQLPVGLRYRLDTWNFEDNKNVLYHDTIGSNCWLESLYEALTVLIEHINFKLASHNHFLSIGEALEEIQTPSFKKYNKQTTQE